MARKARYEEAPGSQKQEGAAGCLPDVEVLDVDVFIRGCLSLAPKEESFLGRGLCKAHSR